MLKVDVLTEERDLMSFKIRELENSIAQLKAKDGELSHFGNSGYGWVNLLDVIITSHKRLLYTTVTYYGHTWLFL